MKHTDIQYMVALDILRKIQETPRISPLEISADIGVSTQYIRNIMRMLYELKLVETPVRGAYIITDLGNHILQSNS